MTKNITNIENLRDEAYDRLYENIMSTANENANWNYELQNINIIEIEDSFVDSFRETNEDGELDMDNSNADIILSLSDEDFESYVEIMDSVGKED